MDEKKKHHKSHPQLQKLSSKIKPSLSLPLPQILLELHAQFYCGSMNTGGLTGKAKEQKQSKVQPVDCTKVHCPPQQARGTAEKPPRFVLHNPPTHYLQ